MTGIGSREVRAHQCVKQPDGERDTGSARCHRDERRFSQQAAHERPPGRAKRQSYSDFLSSVNRSCQEEACKVGARQQQHQTDNDHEQPRAGADVTIHRWVEQDVGRRHEHELCGGIPAVESGLRETRRDARNRRLRLWQRDTRSQSRVPVQRVTATGIENFRAEEFVGHHDRGIKFRCDAAQAAFEIGRRDTDDGVLSAAYTQVTANHIGVGTEPALPVAMVEHDDRVPTR